MQESISLLTLYKVEAPDGIILNIGCGLEKCSSYDDAELAKYVYSEGTVLGKGQTEGGSEVKYIIIDTLIVEEPVDPTDRKNMLLHFFSKKQLRRIEKELRFNQRHFESRAYNQLEANTTILEST